VIPFEILVSRFCACNVEFRVHFTTDILDLIYKSVKMYRPLEMLRDHLLPYWRTIIVIVVPLAMLPLPILAIGTDTEKVQLQKFSIKLNLPFPIYI